MKKITSIFRSWFKSIGNMFTRVNLPKSRNFHVLQTELETNLVLKSCSSQVLYLPPVSLGWNLTTRKQEIEGRSRISPLVESLPSLNKVVVPLFALTGRDVLSCLAHLHLYLVWSATAIIRPCCFLGLVHFSLHHCLCLSTPYILLTPTSWTPGPLHECWSKDSLHSLPLFRNHLLPTLC